MKIGVLGYGSIGSRHVSNLTGMGHETIVFDPAFTQYQSRDRVIEQSDAVVIATPTPRHYQDLLDAMAAGKPTFVEKPIAATRVQWGQLHNYESTKRVFVGYNGRFHPCVSQVRTALSNNAIGEVLHATFFCAQKNTKYANDLAINWSHEIDLACHLFGPAVVDYAGSNGAAHCIDMMLWHDDGMRSHVYLNYVTEPQARGFQIIGTQGYVRVDLAEGNVEASFNHTKITEHADDGYDQSYIDEMTAFIDHVEGKPTVGATGEDGLAVLKLALDARERT